MTNGTQRAKQQTRFEMHFVSAMFGQFFLISKFSLVTIKALHFYFRATALLKQKNKILN